MQPENRDGQSAGRSFQGVTCQGQSKNTPHEVSPPSAHFTFAADHLQMTPACFSDHFFLANSLHALLEHEHTSKMFICLFGLYPSLPTSSLIYKDQPQVTKYQTVILD